MGITEPKCLSGEDAQEYQRESWYLCISKPDEQTDRKWHGKEECLYNCSESFFQGNKCKERVENNCLERQENKKIPHQERNREDI